MVQPIQPMKYYCKILMIIKKYEFLKIMKNIGLTKSLNKLIKKSKGSVIARQDADDTSVPNRLEIQMESYDLKKVRLLYFSCINQKLK